MTPEKRAEELWELLWNESGPEGEDDCLQAIREAIAAEREACALVADTIDRQDEIDNGIAMTGAAGQVAAAIRDRK